MSLLINSFPSEQHMREVAERRQQLELEHEQALAILKFKQDEIKRLQRVRNTALSFGGFFGFDLAKVMLS